MKQTFTRPRFKQRRSLGLGAILFSISVFAQAQQTDTLQTSYLKLPASAVTDAYVTIHPDSVPQGLILFTDTYLDGRVPGLRVTDTDGAPGKGNQLLLRYGTSITNSNRPVVVLDGVVLEEPILWDYISESQKSLFGYTYQSNLNFINPDDLASIRFVKDGALNAAYGPQALNGVLYLDTKKGAKGKGIGVSYSVTAALAQLRKKSDKPLSAAAYRELIETKYPDLTSGLGDASTDWQDVIYRPAFGLNHQLAVNGTLFKHMPYYASVNHANTDGIIETSGYKRTALTASVNPSLLKDHLSLQLSYRKTFQEERLIDRRAVLEASRFNPTQPVYQQNKFGNYFAYVDNNGDYFIYGLPNPLSLLEQKHTYEDNEHELMQAKLSYKLHFYPAISLNARYAKLNQDYEVNSLREAKLASTYLPEDNVNRAKSDFTSEQKEAYLAFNKTLHQGLSLINVTFGINQQKYDQHDEVFENYFRSNNQYVGYRFFKIYSHDEQQRLYATGAFGYKERYTFNAAVSEEKPKEGSGTLLDNKLQSASFGAAWDIAKERFFPAQGWLNSLRLYANYHTLKVLVYDDQKQSFPSYQDESKSKWNAGLAWSMPGGKLAGSVNYFSTRTDDLLLKWRAYGSGINYILLNYGSIVSSGVEANLNYAIKDNEVSSWSVGATLSRQQNKVLLEDEIRSRYTFQGERSGQVLDNGRPMNYFSLYQQIYDSNGYPTESFVTDENRIAVKELRYSADPQLLWSVHSQWRHNKINGGLLVSGMAGNHVYNAMDEYTAQEPYFRYNQPVMNNASTVFVQNGYKAAPSGSNMYLENASFARLEYIQLGYDLGKVWKERASLSLSAAVQNAFVITKYSGQDPEVNVGNNLSHYPQPRTFSLTAKLTI